MNVADSEHVSSIHGQQTSMIYTANFFFENFSIRSQVLNGKIQSPKTLVSNQRINQAVIVIFLKQSSFSKK